ncbi:hypothetical protein [Halomonas dongshanensis]|uniref:Uncharacterized protein n=1 Tax=Halomonas dongshanensis TaxID=2890835 RepID=A0ABT2EAI8_9GAMM|nr:hypothetical protein [Halomonas dongshanensis]MCS2608594.1 hypothetical protein [Halomonas dongshanensis]
MFPIDWFATESNPIFPSSACERDDEVLQAWWRLARWQVSAMGGQRALLE